MTNQLPHEWNAAVHHEAEKTSRETIALAHKVVKNTKSPNPQIVSLEDPVATVSNLSSLVCTLLDVAREQGVIPEMVARLMGKRAGGREQAIPRLLPQVKREIRVEMKECKAVTIPRLDQKAADIAAGKLHPKAKGRGKGPKSLRVLVHIGGAAADTKPDILEESRDGHHAGIFSETSVKKRKRAHCTNTTSATKREDKEDKENQDFVTG